MPSFAAACTAGPMAWLSWARMMSASTPCAMSDSTSESCLAEEDCASAETYSAPASSSAAWIAASSVFQRSSWKLDQLTPTVIPSCAVARVPKPRAVVAARVIRMRIVSFSPSFASARVAGADRTPPVREVMTGFVQLSKII